eukprot:c26833_g1_i1 orf=318-1646(-)
MEVEAIPRKIAIFVSEDDRFMLRQQKYKGQQYSHLYYCRLHKFRGLLSSLIQKRWPAVPVRTILGLQEGECCVVVGTLYKHMQLKPSVLDEYSKERAVGPLTEPHKFMHSDDYLILEDESGRIKLTGDMISCQNYVTGIVIAICGQECSDGEFLVQHILEPGLPPQAPLPSKLTTGEPKFVAFVSGLRVGSGGSNPLQFQLLVDHLTGHLGEEQEQNMTAQIVRVIIAGDSVDMQYSLLANQSISLKEQKKLIEPIKELDISLTQLVSAMPVDIMPGPNDPANFSLPQQPLHKCLFPGAALYSTFFAATNPHQFELDGIRFIGTSGQNIDDLSKYSEGKDQLEYMERTLKWRHLAPTAPDTLGCYPFTDRDPFVIETCPHVYFCGNQDSYASCLVKGPDGQHVRLLSVPCFCETGFAVLLNLRNLDCHLLSLSTTSLGLPSA